MQDLRLWQQEFRVVISITNIADADIINLLGYHNTLMKQNVGDKILVRGKRQGTGGEYVDIDFGVTVGYKQ